MLPDVAVFRNLVLWESPLYTIPYLQNERPMKHC